MRRGIQNIVVVVLAGTLAPGANAQSRTAQATTTVQQAPITIGASRTVYAPRMPRVIGLSVDSATRLLANARIIARGRPIVRRDLSTTTAPRDQVVDQVPKEGAPVPAVG